MQSNYRADIDGLRAVAVGLVVAFHSFPTYVPGGFVGVDVFFVISGYLITGMIQPRVQAGTFSFLEFYSRRIRRIFPALLTVLLAVIALGWFLLFPYMFRQLGLHALAGALFFPNLIFWSEAGYFDAEALSKPLLHLWSLGIEEQFYLIWPVLLIMLGRWARNPVPLLLLLVAASFAYSAFTAWNGQVAGFYSPLSRFWELGVGGLLIFMRPRRFGGQWPAFAGLLSIVGSAFLLDKTDPFPGLLALPSVAGAAVIIALGSRVLAIRPLVWGGLISYPLYLWHWPLLSFAFIEHVATPVERAAIVAGSVGLAWLTYIAIETPVRSGTMSRRAMPPLFAGMMCAGAIGLIIYASGGMPVRYPAEIRPVLETMDYDPTTDARVPDCWITAGAPITSFSPVCSEGTTLIWGDSHAGRLYAGLRKVIPSLAQYTRNSCPPLLIDDSNTCLTGNFAVIEQIRKLRPGVVVLFAAWTNYGKDWAPDAQFPTALRRTIRTLRSAGVGEVVVIGPAPYWDPHLPTAVYDYWSGHGSLPDRLAPARRQDQLAIDAAMAALVHAEGGRFLSLSDVLCNDDGCLTHTNLARSDLMSWDNGHLTTSGAQFAASALHLDAIPGVAK